MICLLFGPRVILSVQEGAGKCYQQNYMFLDIDSNCQPRSQKASFGPTNNFT